MIRRRSAFTLIELLVVMSIIGLLIAIFVPQIPAIMNYYRVHVSRSIMHQVSMGVDEYARVFEAYPYELARMHASQTRMINGETDGSGGWTDSNVCHYGNSKGYASIYLMLQGPDGTGWGPTTAYPKLKAFGPFFDSPGFAAGGSGGGAAYFVDPFGRPVCYFKARVDSKFEDINMGAHGYNDYAHRYAYLTNFNQFEDTGTASPQRGANELPYNSGGVNGKMSRATATLHWEVRLTRSKDAAGWRYAENSKSYVLWLAGGDERFGYWAWSDEHGGYICDIYPEDQGVSDGVLGTCDDILSSGDR